jgi:hypothetical protein
MAAAVTQVKYLGYLYTDMKQGRPGMTQVKLAHDMLLKKNQKKVREMHPLFARGFDATLTMEVSDKGMYLSLPAEESKTKTEECLMNQPLQKIAFVAAIGSKLYLVMKRTGGVGKYRCHGFTLDNEATATECTKSISRLTNEVFARLRHVTRLLEAKKKNKGPPDLAKRAAIKDEDQPWFHGKMSRSGAEQLLLGANMTNGLFLVRQSERSASDYALSFCYNRKVYHNRIMKGGDGKFKNTKGRSWSAIGVMVNDYMSPHEDMQTIITEYVSNKPDVSADGGACYMNVALAVEQAKKKMAANETTTGVKPWDNSDIMQALAEIGDFDGGAISESTEDEGSDIAYDSVYDDQRFGFGADFIKATLGAAKGGVQPKAEYDLDAMVFSCGDIEGEADC